MRQRGEPTPRSTVNRKAWSPKTSQFPGLLYRYPARVLLCPVAAGRGPSIYCLREIENGSGNTTCRSDALDVAACQVSCRIRRQRQTRGSRVCGLPRVTRTDQRSLAPGGGIHRFRTRGPAGQPEDDRQRELLLAGRTARTGQSLHRQVCRRRARTPLLRRLRQRRHRRKNMPLPWPATSSGRTMRTYSRIPAPTQTSWRSGPSFPPAFRRRSWIERDTPIPRPFPTTTGGN